MIVFQPPVYTADEWRELNEYLDVAAGSLRELAFRAESTGVKKRLKAWSKRCDQLRTRIEHAQAAHLACDTHASYDNLQSIGTGGD